MCECYCLKYDLCAIGRIGRWGGRGAKLARIRQQEEGLAEEARKKLGLSPIQRDAVVLDTTQEKPKKSKRKRTREDRDVEDALASNSSPDNCEEAVVQHEGKSKNHKRKEKESCRSARKKTEKQGKGLISKKSKKESKKKRGLKDESSKVKAGMGLDKDISKEKGVLKAGKAEKGSKTSKLKSKSKVKSSQSVEEFSSEVAQKKKLKKEKKKKKSKASQAVGDDNAICNSYTLVFPDPTPSIGWWGAKRFISGGFSGQVREVIPLDRRERQVFDEDDQEKVYMFAHNSKRKGKIGLGC